MERHIAANLDNEQFGVEQLADLVGLSRSQLHRKLKKINGKSISTFIREYRLEKARALLLKNDMTASEVAHAVGFSSASYFSTCFTKLYGYPPGKVKQKSYIAEAEIPSMTTTKRGKGRNLVLVLGTVALILMGFLFYSSGSRDMEIASKPEEKSVIVLPFKNLSSEEENQYLAEGMVDAISRHLSGITELKVIAPSAIDQFLEENKSIKAIGEQLRVSNILEGSLQRQGDIFRIEVKLIATKNGQELWAANYDRKFGDFLKIQSDIAKKVANTLEANMTSKEVEIIDRQTSYNPQAYDHYLKGMYYFNLQNANTHHKSRENFQRALELDSTLALAHAGIAAYYLSQGNASIAKMNAEETLGLADPHIQEALRLDPENPYSHLVNAFILTFHKWNFTEAEISFKKSLEMKDPMAFNTYRDFLQFEHRHTEALKIAKLSNEINPFQPGANMILPYYFNNQWEEGEKYIEEQLELHPNHYPTYSDAGFFMLNFGEYDRAIALFDRGVTYIGKRSPRVSGWLAAAYAKKGDVEKARKILEELKSQKALTDAGSPAFYIAVIYTVLEEEQEAFKWLNTAMDDREIEVPWLVSEPQLYPLHGHPEFDLLVKQIGFRPHAYPVRVSNSMQ